jgi:hypothetical protein
MMDQFWAKLMERDRHTLNRSWIGALWLKRTSELQVLGNAMSRDNLRSLTFLLMAAALAMSPARAVTIDRDNGGRFSDYLERIRAFYRSAEEVKIRGPCISACTLYLVLPNICVGRKVSFHFHAPRDPDTNRVDPEFVAYFVSLYPPWVSDWIKARGGLSHDPRKWLSMRNSYARRFLRECGKPMTPTMREVMRLSTSPDHGIRLMGMPVPRKKPRQWLFFQKGPLGPAAE